MFDLEKVQSALHEAGLDGWLLYDFRGSNPLARRILDLGDRKPGSRRFFYFIPARGTPVKVVHAIESAALDHLPGTKRVFSRWQELEAAVGEQVAGRSRIAMEYSPRNANPYIGRVDAGTIEMVRSFGPEIVSSGDLIQEFEATWDDDQWRMLLRAAEVTDSAFDVAFGLIRKAVRDGRKTSESEVQRAILDHFAAHGLVTYSPPNVSVGPHSGDPHYEMTAETDAPIGPGDFVLIDLWAKVDDPKGVYSDLTRVGYVGETVPEKYEQVFDVVARARDAAIAAVRDAFAAGRPIRGGEVDDAARSVIEAAGLGKFYTHRTGHNIGREVHGNGAHLDNLETRDDRLILRRTGFSIEPGVYYPDDFGIRSEVNLFVDAGGQVHVTGGEPQERVLAILA
ncbi:M24 family metallopeptidase [Tundrisphaera sp. TA3]|uniref:M24 family metallopeptidase n=1 Tax=Tundrisphaera sp. TA3 TaxID=3435775 RepID=UPI003EBDA47C